MGMRSIESTSKFTWQAIKKSYHFSALKIEQAGRGGLNPFKPDSKKITMARRYRARFKARMIKPN